jgi:hypothetical protein
LLVKCSPYIGAPASLVMGVVYIDASGFKKLS